MKYRFQCFLMTLAVMLATGCTSTSEQKLQQMIEDYHSHLPLAINSHTVLLDVTIEDSCVRYKYNVIDTAGLVTSVGKNQDGILLNFSQSLDEPQFRDFVALVASSDKSIVYSYNEVKTGATADVTITADEIRQMLAAAEQ